MNSWVENKRVGVKSVNAIQRLLRKAASGKAVPDHWGAGRRSIVSIDKLSEEVTDFLGQNVGHAVGKYHTKELLLEKKKTILKSQGRDISNVDIHARTVNAYHTALAASNSKIVPIPGPTALKPPIDKTPTCHTAETSLISAMAFALVVVASQFVPGDKENFPDEDNLTEGAKLTLKMVRQANPGIKMQLIGPHLNFNHDDFGQFLIRNSTDKTSNGKKWNYC